MKESTFLDDQQIVPVYSSFLWFKASHRRLPKLKPNHNAAIATENGTYILKDFEINEALRKEQNVCKIKLLLYFHLLLFCFLDFRSNDCFTQFNKAK